MHQTMPEGKVNHFEILPENSPKEPLTGNQFIIDLSNLEKGQSNNCSLVWPPCLTQGKVMYKKGFELFFSGTGVQ